MTRRQQQARSRKPGAVFSTRKGGKIGFDIYMYEREVFRALQRVMDHAFTLCRENSGTDPVGHAHDALRHVLRRRGAHNCPESRVYRAAHAWAVKGA